MFLKKLILGNFKNYELAEAEFGPSLNILFGNNGTGKTNLLDAVHYLCFCKSFLNPADNQNIRHGSDHFYLEGLFENPDQSEELIHCGLKRDRKKQFKRNKKEYEKLADHIGLLPLVLISPSDSVLIEGLSEDRRKFIDSLISVYDKQYLTHLIQYNRLLSQRNALLKSFYEQRNFNLEMLEIYDEQMSAPSEYIHAARTGLSAFLIPAFQKNYDDISGGHETVSLQYRSVLNDSRPLKEHLNESLHRDRAALYTSEGIHKDDWVFTLGELPIKKIGSQGQQKSYLTALKAAQYDILRQKTGKLPILLLDDIFDKLDDQRVERLLLKVSGSDYGQVFITDTGRERIEKILKEKELNFRLFKTEDQNIQICEKE